MKVDLKGRKNYTLYKGIPKKRGTKGKKKKKPLYKWKWSNKRMEGMKVG
jgi:hypothetical protein